MVAATGIAVGTIALAPKALVASANAGAACGVAIGGGTAVVTSGAGAAVAGSTAAALAGGAISGAAAVSATAAAGAGESATEVAAAAGIGAVAGGSAAAAVTSMGAGASSLVAAGIAAGPLGWLVLGAVPDALTFDCWKIVLHDESPEPSKGRLMKDVVVDLRIKEVSILNGSENSAHPEIVLENIWDEQFYIQYVLLPSNELAAHAVVLK